MTIVLSFIFFVCFFVPVLSQPLSLGISIMILSSFLSVFMGFLGFSLYGFILFLVFVGGLLVMFGYVVVLIPNMSFSVSSFFFFFFLSFFLVWFDFDLPSFCVSDLLFSDFSFFLYLGLSLILLLCLVVVVKVCYFHSGSLRPFFYAAYV